MRAAFRTLRGFSGDGVDRRKCRPQTFSWRTARAVIGGDAKIAVHCGRLNRREGDPRQDHDETRQALSRLWLGDKQGLRHSRTCQRHRATWPLPTSSPFLRAYPSASWLRATQVAEVEGLAQPVRDAAMADLCPRHPQRPPCEHGPPEPKMGCPDKRPPLPSQYLRLRRRDRHWPDPDSVSTGATCRLRINDGSPGSDRTSRRTARTAPVPDSGPKDSNTLRCLSGERRLRLDVAGDLKIRFEGPRPERSERHQVLPKLHSRGSKAARFRTRGAGLTKTSFSARPSAASCWAITAPMECPSKTGFLGSCAIRSRIWVRDSPRYRRR